MARALILLVALCLPVMSSVPAADAAQLRMPSRADVRSSAEHLWDWVTGSHAAAPRTPAQETGTAAAKPHQVPAAVTRAVRGAGHAPGEGPGQLPAYAPHAPQPKTFVAGTSPAPGHDPFSQATSTLVPSASTATSDTYRNADGSYTRHVYSAPVNYRTASGSWAAINTGLAAGTGGRWHERANSVGASFAARASDPALGSLSFGGSSQPGPFGMSFSLAGAADVAGTAAGPTVTYPGVLAGTDLVETDIAAGVKESLVLHSAQAATKWVFPLHLTGLTAQLNSDGSVQLVDSSGQVQGLIPEGLATDSRFDSRAGPIGATTQVTYQLVSYDGGTALQASIDPAWLADPARVFPVTVDPTTVNAQSTSTTFVQYPDTIDNSGGPVLKLGTYNGGGSYARTFLAFANLGSDYQNQHITAAQLHVFDIWAYTCGSAEPFWANVITQPWDPATTKSWPGPATGTGAGYLDAIAPSAACSNNSLNPDVGGWMTMNLSTDILNAWTLGTSPDYGLALTNSTTDSNQWKQFDSRYTPFIPYLSMTYTPDVQPQVDSQYPPDNYNATSLTPELMASGSDADNWPDPLQYQFNVYNSSGTKIVSSNLQTSPDWNVPKGDLKWGQTYYWTVQDYDGLDYSVSPPVNYFATPVPQPLISSGLSQSTSGPGFDPATGNYTTTATDAQVTTVGPALSIERDYNSLNSDPSGAFGAGWSSILDMQAAPGEVDSSSTTATVNVTYPDGQQVGFGENADGSYSPPQGRFATFAAASGSTPGYTLTDKNDTVYKFTQSLGSGAYGITSVTDALGHALTFTYNSASQVTTITSAASGRALHVTWSTPSGASYAHVASVTTDPVTAGNSASALTWTYSYTGDQLNTVCPPTSSTACSAYSYTAGSQYPDAVLDSGAHSYWRMDETSGGTAASSVLVNEGTDNASYSGATLGQPGPLPGSTATSASFNGTSSYVKLPGGLVSGASYQSVSAWFKTTAGGGVIFSSSADPITNGTTAGQYTPSLYIGSNGDLNAEFWTGTSAPMLSSAPVNDGKWHLAVLAGAGNTQTLYVDGKPQKTMGGTIAMLHPQNNDYAGVGFIGGNWPNEPHQSSSSNTGYATYFNGSLSDVALWDRPLTAPEVSALYTAGTQQASLLTKVTRPTGGVYSQVGYNGPTSAVTSVTDSNGGNWSLAAPSVTGSSQVYVSSVLGAGPADYYRLADTGTSQAVDQIKGGTASYSTVTQGVTGPFSDATADSFNGTSSSLALPAADQVTSGPGTIELWFKTTASNEVIYSTDNSPLGSATTPSGYTPSLYVGQGGDLNAQFWVGSTTKVITSPKPVNDGKWHFAVLSASTSSQTLYIDGAAAGSALQAALTGTPAAYAYLGGGYLGGGWPNESHQSSTSNTGYASYFNGSIAEFASYRSQLSAAEVTDQYNASKSSAGLTPLETVNVTDPAGKVMSYAYDPLNGNRVISQTDALGNTTTYGYDTAGFVNTVTDPDGDVTTTGHDVRGNLVSQTTCQNQAADKCSTSYYGYYPDDTSATLKPDPRNDMRETQRDGRSSSATDSTYLTTDAYNSLGELTTQTTPPVPGYSSGRTTTTTYTDGTTIAAAGGGFAPAGLPYQVTTPGGATASTQYDSDGDVAQTTDADGMVTKYTYDGLGRVLTKTVTSNSYPNGLTTSYSYNGVGEVTGETDPGVTDRVTGAIHTAQISTSYDADGDVTGQTVADTTGGDASRSVSYSYDPHDLLATSTDATSAVTRYSYDGYGDLASETDPAGHVSGYVYDADGRLLTTTLQNYTGDPVSPSPATNLVESSRSYDPAGRLASITDSMGWVTSYTYTDDGLTASITRSDPHSGASFTEEADSYDAAGNLISKTASNGATTTTYQVDAADRTAAETLDPSGLDRTTTYSYTPDDDVATETLTGGGSSTPVSSTSYTYDPMGNKTSQSQALPGAGVTPAAWWRLDQASGTTVPDAAGGGNTATATGATWGNSAASFAGASGQGITTNGPVVNTAGSFSVSAWVNLAGDTSSYQGAVSEHSATEDGFRFQYDAGTGKWAFDRARADSAASPQLAVAESSSAAATGTWTHLVGTYNVASGTLTLYVNGAATGSDTDTTPFAASGSLAIGQDQYAGTTGDWFDGQVADVRVYSRALSAPDVSALYQAGRDAAPSPANQLTTSWALDQRGLPTAMTDPNGNVTRYGYDEAGRLAATTEPAVAAQTYGGTGVTAAPVTMTGYNTFGEPVESSDANGNVTTTGYDAEGRPLSVTAPPYTPPGGSPVTVSSTKAYNSLGQVTAQTDGLGNKTTYSYDQLSDVATITAPDNGVTHYTYDTDGDQLSVTGPTGAVTQSTYDFLGRKLTSTGVERYPSAASYTTSYAYGNGGWLSSQNSPDSVPVSYGYDAAGEKTSQTDGASNKTSYGYDAAGDLTSTINPDGTSTTATFDEAGRQTAQADLSGTGAVLRSESSVYDGNGDLTAATDYRGNTTTYTYDASGAVAQEVQPVSATSAITTSFGYDTAGNQTRYTDGNGHPWWTTYNSWNLPESKIEPATAQYTTAAGGTFTTAYNADGQPVTQAQPGGVTVSASYDSMGNLTGQTGAGADAPTTARSFGYDQAGNMTSASAPGGTDSFSYNDRGLLLSASGPSGSSSFAYNGDGQVSSVSDAAGTTSYGYDSAGRLATLADPATGTTASYSYNPESQVSRISYGSGNDTRSFGYNTLHQLTSDTLATSSGQTVASIGYGYDPNGNLTSKATTGFSGSASNTYGYDEANRLTSWNNGTATTAYGYDGAGNRTQAGSKTYTYDARDQLTSDGTNSYGYTARGTLASETTPSATVNFASDAFGQSITQGTSQGTAQGTQTYAYDALGRLVSDTGSSGSGSAAFSYSGTGSTLASDGTSTYTWDPSGASLAGIGVAGGSAPQGTIALTDAHSDVVGDFTASGSSLAGSAAYDPLGTVLSSPGLSGRLGYQSGWTDPATKNVDMGARWYNPSVGQFQNRDTASVNPVGNSAAANPFAYVGDDPLGATDPTGHMLCEDDVCGSVQFLEHYHAPKPAPVPHTSSASHSGGGGFWGWVPAPIRHFGHSVANTFDKGRHALASGGDYVYHRYVHPAIAYVADRARSIGSALVSTVRRGVQGLSTVVNDAGSWGAHAAGAVWNTVKQGGSRFYHAATKLGHAAVNAVKTGYHAVAHAATATVAYVKHHAAAIASIAVSTVVFIGCDAALGVATGGIGAVAGAAACGALAGAVGGAVAYGITAAQTGHFSLAGLGKAALGGAIAGGLTAGLVGGASAVFSGLLRSGAADAASALSSKAADEAATTTTEAAATTADSAGRSAAEDAAARSGGEDSAESCSANSFTSTTKVLLPGGMSKAISKIKAGQKVEATDPYTKVTAARRVAGVIVHHGLHAMAAIALLGGLVLHATAQHPVYDATTKAFTYAADLHSGDKLLEPSGRTIEVTSVRHYDATLTAYNLDVTGIHTYYALAGSTPVLVHNSCDPVYRVLRPDEDPSEGLFPKDPNGNVSLDEHVRFGSRPDFASQFISTTKNVNIARIWAARTGNRMVSIDLSQVNGDVIDLTTYENRDYYLLDARGRGYAMRSAEVVIQGSVPPSAVSPVSPAP